MGTGKKAIEEKLRIEADYQRYLGYLDELREKAQLADMSEWYKKEGLGIPQGVPYRTYRWDSKTGITEVENETTPKKKTVVPPQAGDMSISKLWEKICGDKHP